MQVSKNWRKNIFQNLKNRIMGVCSKNLSNSDKFGVLGSYEIIMYICKGVSHLKNISHKKSLYFNSTSTILPIFNEIHTHTRI